MRYRKGIKKQLFLFSLLYFFIQKKKIFFNRDFWWSEPISSFFLVAETLHVSFPTNQQILFYKWKKKRVWFLKDVVQRVKQLSLCRYFSGVFFYSYKIIYHITTSFQKTQSIMRTSTRDFNKNALIYQNSSFLEMIQELFILITTLLVSSL